MNRTRMCWAAAALLLLAAPVWAVLNNGFETDYVWAARDPGQGADIRVFNKADGAQIGGDWLLESWDTLTFSGTGTSDARLFVAKPSGDDIAIAELNASAGHVKDKMLSEIVGTPFVAGSAPVEGGIRYNALTNTLFLAVNPYPADPSGAPQATVYEFDLDLSTLIHTYVGPILPSSDPRPPYISFNARNKIMYMIGRNLGGNVGKGDMVSFNMAGRAIGGTTTTYTKLIDGVAYSATDGRYTYPQSLIYRKRAGAGSEDTVIVFPGSGSGSVASLEFYLDTTDHPSGNPNYLALRGTSISVARGWNGLQDRATGSVWIAALRGGIHVVRPDDTKGDYDDSRWRSDVATPFNANTLPPVITPVTPDPEKLWVGVPYVKQLGLTQGTDPITWTLVQAPGGATITQTGLISGWTPGPTDLGGLFVFSAAASNSVGDSTVTWHVLVPDLGRQVALWTFDNDADGWTLDAWKSCTAADCTTSPGVMEWLGTGGNPGGVMHSTGIGATDNSDTCTREGGIMTMGYSTIGLSQVALKFDVTTQLDGPMPSGCSGSSACTANLLDGNCEDKVVVQYSTTGTAGPWISVGGLTESVNLPSGWTSTYVDFPNLAGVAGNPDFAMRIIWQFNTVNDNGYIDNVSLWSGCSAPAADADGDGDVDQADFSVLQLCFTGSLPNNQLRRVCGCLDLGDDNSDGMPDHDGDIDGFDVSAFEMCASGPGIPANPACGG
jgi:hypothetical protein